MEQVLGITVRMEDEESDKDEMLSFASALHNFSNRCFSELDITAKFNNDPILAQINLKWEGTSQIPNFNGGLGFF
ncbi:unnamed protein product [Allacma fusca]|uniref:Uncharacterized protein n=1 Tax=Allacma fusca TaxID=39272 RepID=A0A8J2K7G4_9HEXA|nr:unnamed protein product [Allacma fusca]